MNITDLTLTETIEALKNKQFSEAELNHAYHTRIREHNDKLNAYLHVEETKTGIPAAIKDIISTKDIPTTAGSKILEGYKPPYDATVIKKLKENNVSVIGKTNNDEFAMGSSGENSAYGVTKNPWDLKKVPGGSSSGSAVAVAADLAVFSLGSDTGGSIRQPASLSGVVGLKPSYGRISRYGFISMASSLDCPGPFTKSVADARLLLEWLEGADGYDSNVTPEIASPKGIAMTNSSTRFPHVIQSGLSEGSQGLKGVKVGIPKEYFGKGLNTNVERVIKESISKLEELGAEIVEVSLPHTEYAVAVYYIVMSSEVSSNLARFDGIRFGKTRDKFGAEPKRRIMLGTYSLSSGYYDAYFTKAAQVRTLIKQDFERAFEKCDVIAGPVSPTVAWDLGAKVNDPLEMYLSDAYTIPADLAGIPGISVPCGFVEGLPVGLQLMGPYMGDNLILDVAEAYETACQWRNTKPQLVGGRGTGVGDE
jgi:aspartyl-tRNA(Asn)/glutamyl-tRNA(Gln) amidotransferase subunit A